MSTNTASDEIDIGSVWQIVRSWLPGIAICAAIAGALTFAVLSLVASRYEAETQLTITVQTSNPFTGDSRDANAAAASVTPRLDPAAINTHVRAIMAPDLLLKVGRKLKLENLAEFNSAIGYVDTLDAIMRTLGIGGPRSGETADQRMLAAMHQRLQVSAARESRFISVRFTANDPQVAADVANGIAETYRKTLREIPVRETNEAVTVLEPKIKQLTKEVYESEAAAKRFRAESDQLTSGAQQTTLQQQRLATLNQDLVKAEADLNKAQGRLEAARELSVNGAANTLPEVQSSRVIQDLIAQRVRVERQVSEAQAVLLPAHPRMRQLNGDLAGVRSALKSEISTIVASISKELNAAERRVRLLQTQIAKLKKNVIAQSTDEAKLRALESNATSKRNELARLQRQLEDNRTVVDTNRVPVESTIISRARPSNMAVFPKKTSYTFLAAFGTFMIGFALAVARALMAIGLPMARAGSESRRAPSHAENYSPRAQEASFTSDLRAGASVYPGVQAQPAPAVDNSALRLDQFRPPAASRGPAARPQSRKPDAPRTSAPARSAAPAQSKGSPAPAKSGAARGKAGPTAGKTRSAANTLQGVARRLGASATHGGYRFLIAGANRAIDPGDEAVEVAGEMSDKGTRVLLIDWSMDGNLLFNDVDTDGAASIADLLDGASQFDDVLIPLPDTRIHYAFAARGHDARTRHLTDAVNVNMVLDALDEAYDAVIVVGKYDDARQLFETIEGRFDAAMTVADNSGLNKATIDMPSPNSFLGFNVTDIEILHYDRADGTVAGVNQKPVSRRV